MKQEKHEVKLESGDKITKAVSNKPEGIKDMLGISKDQMDKMYQQAYLLYNTGRYNDAAQIFRILLSLNTGDAKYTLGLAACYHMMKDYNQAAGTYLVVSTLDPHNPIPFFHASDCYIQMGDKVSAMLMLEMALKKAKEAKEYATLKQRAEITLAALKKGLSLGKS